jgi:serine/threonine protein kinase
METSPMPVLRCLECGATISPEAKGLCPRCLLKLGFASQLSPGFIETGTEPPPFLKFDPLDPSKRSVIEPFEFGGYRILRLLGKGGMGAVYEAEEIASGRRVALKVLGHSLDSADTRKRFIREGRLAASINHPNSVYVYGTEEIEGAPVITMELVPGGTLHERVKEGGAMPIADAVDTIMQSPDPCFLVSTHVAPRNRGGFGVRCARKYASVHPLHCRCTALQHRLLRGE